MTDQESKHPYDPASDQPSLPFQIKKLRTHFFWITEHALELEAARKEGKLIMDPSFKSPGLNHELSGLIDSAKEGKAHLDRLCELLKEKGIEV